MLKINDVAYISNLDERYDGHHAKEGDICIIVKVFEGGTDPWSGRDEGENYMVLNERTGETITLSWTTSLRLYNKPYKRKTAEELKEARKQAFREWIEAEKRELEEMESLKGTDEIVREITYDLINLENDYRKGNCTEEYFNRKMVSLVNCYNDYWHRMSKCQKEYNQYLNKTYAYLWGLEVEKVELSKTNKDFINNLTEELEIRSQIKELEMKLKNLK